MPDLFAGDNKGETSNAALRFSLEYGGQSASGVTSDARGLKDFLSVLKDLLKVAQEHTFGEGKTHGWMSAYTEDLSHHNHGHHHGAPQIDTPIFSRFSASSFLPHPPSQNHPQIPARPASPTASDIRICVGTFNVNGVTPPDDIPTIIGLKKWIRAELDPDLIVLGFQEVDTSSGAYLYYSPAKEEAWTRAITQALGRRADKYRKLASKQLVGLMIIVFVRKEMEGSIGEVATASVGVGLGGFVANKGATAVRMKVGDRTVCFVNSHLSAMEGLQAMERRCWDWNEIYKRLRFRLVHDEEKGEVEDFWETPAKVSLEGKVKGNGGSDMGDLSQELPTNPFKTAKDAQHEAESEYRDSANGHAMEDVQTSQEGDSTSEQVKELHKDTETVNVNGATVPANLPHAPHHDHLNPPLHPSSSSPSSPIPSTSSYTEHPIMAHDIVIHFGDLNFRLDLSHSEAHRLIRSRQYSLLYRYDQLDSLRSSGSLFDDFEEGNFDFAPTYKFDKGTDRYDTSEKQRVPAWTDRIMWSVTKEWEDDGGLSATLDDEGEDGKEREKRRKQGVVLQAYESVPDLKFSDHRPVRATFLVRIR